MKGFRLLSLSVVLLTVAGMVSAETWRYKVTIKNNYPVTGSLVKLDTSAKIPYFPTPQSYYNPLPPPAVIERDYFIFCGIECSQAARSAPQDHAFFYTYYTLFGADGNKLLSCRLDYGWENGSCSAKATPIPMSLLPGITTPGCKGQATNVANGCDVEFKFYHPM